MLKSKFDPISGEDEIVVSEPKIFSKLLQKRIYGGGMGISVCISDVFFSTQTLNILELFTS